MNAGLESSNCFIKVKDVNTPDIFNRRFKTNVLNLDKAFCADGWVPGSTFTINGTPGSGKTTLLCQMLQKLADRGKRVAYISGEESVHQLAYNCKRIKATDISVANMNDLKKIQEIVKHEKFDFIILDSFPCFHMPGIYRTTKDREHAAVECVLSTAHESECVVGCVLHVTKTGTYKGSTLLPHAVDANYSLTKDELDESVRHLDAMKNRFGTSSKSAFKMTDSGFSFDTIQEKELKRLTNLSDLIEKQPCGFSFEDVARIYGNVDVAYNAIRDGVLGLKILQVGTGKNTIWIKRNK